MKLKAVAFALFACIPMFASAATAECSEDVLFKFFPRGFVTEVLKEHDIPQDKINNITETLYQADQEVFDLITSTAQNMEPNPLEDINAEAERAKLFRDSLMQVFTAALEQNGITDPQKIQTMLDEIQQKRLQRFIQCQKEGRLPSKVPEVNRS